MREQKSGSYNKYDREAEEVNTRVQFKDNLQLPEILKQGSKILIILAKLFLKKVCRKFKKWVVQNQKKMVDTHF